MRAYVTLLRDNPDFFRLWLAQVVSLLGDWFNTIALTALVITYSPDNPGLATGGLLLARFLPSMILSPFAGVLIDRFDRKRLLVWCNYLRAVVVLGFLVATTGPQWVWLIYVLSTVQFLLSSVFEPGQQAVTPALVRREDLITANTLMNITWSGMLAVGAIIGGLVAEAAGTNTALVFDAITFVVAGLLVAGIRKYQIETTASKNPTPETIEKVTFLDGVRYLRRTPEAASTLLVKFGTSLGNVDTVMIIFATQVFVMGEDGKFSLGILYSAFGIGAIVGPLLLNRFNNGDVGRIRRLILIGFGLAAVAWFILGSAGSIIVVCIGLIVRAMGGSVNWTYSSIIIQKTADDAYLGRVSSWDWSLFYLSVVISTVVHSSLVDHLGSENVRTVALLTLVVAIPMFVIWSLVVRRLRRNTQVQIGQSGV